ncbi:hypothetical protein HYPSUDRAFT_1056978 [Hypholoma sublateritium FD-334 SS-4]|uniref:Uncharacterized protein n=1 Tax=Hypholoma sublateritium (strain FD-334 SS-4) TaxID=945553 RepID=A0A0D2NCD5_HYPSF|nr:hypothetical protein HYPSUDRAFT_1056978 [Hypholoma sublateritium FD-334 SS-4]
MRRCRRVHQRCRLRRGRRSPANVARIRFDAPRDCSTTMPPQEPHATLVAMAGRVSRRARSIGRRSRGHNASARRRRRSRALRSRPSQTMSRASPDGGTDHDDDVVARYACAHGETPPSTKYHARGGAALHTVRYMARCIDKPSTRPFRRRSGALPRRIDEISRAPCATPAVTPRRISQQPTTLTSLPNPPHSPPAPTIVVDGARRSSRARSPHRSHHGHTPAAEMAPSMCRARAVKSQVASSEDSTYLFAAHAAVSHCGAR